MGSTRTKGTAKRLGRATQTGGCHDQEGVFRSRHRSGARAGAWCSVRPTRLSRRMARWRLGRWRLAGRRLGSTSGGPRYRPRDRQRGGMGTTRLGPRVGTRLGCSRLELCQLGWLHEMASGLDRLELARRASERLLVVQAWLDYSEQTPARSQWPDVAATCCHPALLNGASEARTQLRPACPKGVQKSSLGPSWSGRLDSPCVAS